MAHTITVKQLSAMFEDINSGNYKPINRIDENIWECNGLWIEYGFYGDEYSVQFCGDDIMFDTFGDAVEFCRNN